MKRETIVSILGKNKLTVLLTEFINDLVVMNLFDVLVDEEVR